MHRIHAYAVDTPGVQTSSGLPSTSTCTVRPFQISVLQRRGCPPRTPELRSVRAGELSTPEPGEVALAEAADAPVGGVVLHLRYHLCVCRRSRQHSIARRRRSNLDQRHFRSVGIALGVPRACVEKMLASGYINRLGDGTRNGICLIRGLIVEANRPLADRTGAVCDCLHLDMTWILTW
jgi:hypothetical protein